MSWIDQLGDPPDYPGEIDVITTDVNAPAARTTAELSARLKAAGGTLIVGPQSSDFIVATNNRLQFSVEPDATRPGMYRITPSYLLWYLVGGGVAFALIVLARQ